MYRTRRRPKQPAPGTSLLDTVFRGESGTHPRHTSSHGVYMWDRRMRLLLLLLGCCMLSAYRSCVSRRMLTRVNLLDTCDIMLQPSYGLVEALGLTSALLTAAAVILKPLRASPAPILACILAFLTKYAYDKTESVRYRFDSSSFSLVAKDGSSIGANPVTGGDYSWDYRDIKAYKIIPSQALPIFMYVEELETPLEDRIVAPFTARGAVGVQVHYFPLITDVKEIESSFKQHSVPQLDEVPLEIQRDFALFVKGLQLI